MQSKQKYYSAPVPHPGIPGAYYASFGSPGSSNQYVMGNGKKQIFTTLELAELHGFRAMMLNLNKSEGTKEKQVPRKVRPLFNNQSADHVFSNFGKKDT